MNFIGYAVYNNDIVQIIDARVNRTLEYVEYQILIDNDIKWVNLEELDKVTYTANINDSELIIH